VSTSAFSKFRIFKIDEIARQSPLLNSVHTGNMLKDAKNVLHNEQKVLHAAEKVLHAVQNILHSLYL
jgi:hypothetical protein